MPDNKSSKFALQVSAVQPDLHAGINNLKRKAEFADRSTDSSMVNADGDNASLRLFGKKINQAASQNTSQKMTDKQAVTTSFEEKHVTNRFNLEAYDFIFNGHKLNPNLWEYSDMKKYTDMYGEEHAVGGFTMMGTVLTPSWDEQLHRYVLIRRQVRMPMFSPKNNVPEILKTLNIDDPTKVAYEYGLKQSTETAKDYYERVGNKFDNKKYAGKDLDESSGGSGDSGSGSGGSVSGGEGTCSSAQVEKAVKIAIDLGNQGLPYVWGAGGPDSFDCTGFISYAFQQAGWPITPCHGTAFDDAFMGMGFEYIPYTGGDISQLKRGDILSNSHHVELYIGGGQQVGAHSSASGVNVVDASSGYWSTYTWENIYRYKG